MSINRITESVLNFMKKHDFDYADIEWVDRCNLIIIQDYYIDFETVKYDISNNIPENYFTKWYDEQIIAGQKKSSISFEKWCKIKKNTFLNNKKDVRKGIN